jgi:hypothetical protein
MRVVRLLMAPWRWQPFPDSCSLRLRCSHRRYPLPVLRPYLEVLEDPSGSLTLDQVQQPETARRFAPVKAAVT